MYAFCLRAGQTRSDGTRTGTGKRGDTRAARTEGGDDDAPQEEGDTQKKQRARDDTQICHGSSGTEETPSVIHACIYTNTKVHQHPMSPVIRLAPAAACNHVR